MATNKNDDLLKNEEVTEVTENTEVTEQAEGVELEAPTIEEKPKKKSSRGRKKKAEDTKSDDKKEETAATEGETVGEDFEEFNLSFDEEPAPTIDEIGETLDEIEGNAKDIEGKDENAVEDYSNVEDVSNFESLSERVSENDTEDLIEEVEDEDDDFGIESDSPNKKVNLDDTSFEENSIIADQLYQSSFDSSKGQMGINEKWNAIKALARAGRTFRVRIITTAIKRLRDNRATGKTTYNEEECVVCKLDAPFQEFFAYIPYASWFKDAREEYSMRDTLKRTAKNNISSRSRLVTESISLYLNAIDIASISYVYFDADTGERIIVASRKRALDNKESYYFDRGVRYRGKLTKPDVGTIVRNCNILFVKDECIYVNVCGIPTRINKKDLSWKFVTSAKELFEKGDTTDVIIREIRYITIAGRKNVRIIRASVKGTTPDTTIPALEMAEKRMGKAGKVSGVISDIVDYNNSGTFRYYIQTDLGYRACARNRNVVDLLNSNQRMKSTKIPEIGDTVFFVPRERRGNMMFGYFELE